MTAENFRNCLPIILRFEGGKSNDPRDPGGRTNKGITQRTYNAYRAAKGHPPADVYAITQAEVEDCYRRDYWNAVKGDSLRSGEDLVVFDLAVNSGPARALRIWNAAGGAAVAQGDIVRGVCAKRLAFMQSLSTWPYFKNGWATRVAKVQKSGLAMVAGKTTTPTVDIKPGPAGGAVVVGGGTAAAGAWQWLDNPWIVAGLVIAGAMSALYVWATLKKRQQMTSIKTSEPPELDPSDVLEAAIARVSAARGALDAAISEAFQARDAVAERGDALRAAVAGGDSRLAEMGVDLAAIPPVAAAVDLGEVAAK